MGTRIEAAATAQRQGRATGRRALHLTDIAAHACLRHAHHEPEDLDLLINAGMHKTHHTAEPVFASIVQDDLGAQVGPPPRIGHQGTFSFDIVDGGCGVLSAAQLVDAFVGHGTAKLGMIVAADGDPARASRGHPFTPAGAAMLIASVEGERGFVRFARRTFAEHAALFESHLRWDARAGLTHRRNVLEVFEAPELAARCVEDAVAVATEMLAETDLYISDIDLLIASQYPRTFPIQLARDLGLPLERVPRVPRQLEGSHTAGPIGALEAAIDSGAFRRAHYTLFVTAGTGLTIGTALYRT